mgnify:CR=1 FL=1
MAEPLRVTKEQPFSCPNCGKHCSSSYGEIGEPTSFVKSFPSEFKEEPDPHFSWEELHKCLACETEYLLVNRT